MLEPVEAEFAKPPIFSNQQEDILREEEIEEPNAISDAGKQATCGSDNSTLHGHQSSEKINEKDVEKGKDEHIIVQFDEGEGPKQWSKGRKW